MTTANSNAAWTLLSIVEVASHTDEASGLEMKRQEMRFFDANNPMSAIRKRSVFQRVSKRGEELVPEYNVNIDALKKMVGKEYKGCALVRAKVEEYEVGEGDNARTVNHYTTLVFPHELDTLASTFKSLGHVLDVATDDKPIEEPLEEVDEATGEITNTNVRK